MTLSPKNSLDQEIIRLHATICQALSDTTRIRLLYALNEKDLNVSELTQRLQMPQPTISRHLKVLHNRNLVTASRQGNSVIYKLADERIIEALDILRAVLADSLENHGALARAV